MAQATQTAPLKTKTFATKEDELIDLLGIEINPNKKYVFELAEKNQERENLVWNMRTNRPAPRQEFKPFVNVVMTSQIVWKNARVNLRYYDGCDTIFSSDQPKDKEMLDQLIKSTKLRHFDYGKLGVYGDEKMLFLYMMATSWNGNSPFRTRTAEVKFFNVDTAKQAEAKISRLDKIEEAMKYAREASFSKMKVHASYLGLSLTDFDSGEDYTESELRPFYREAASNNPETFIESYGNQSIEVKYFIDKALEDGTISNKHNPNKATWKSSNTIICDISGLKSNEAISSRLYEFSQLEEGQEFLVQLKAIYKD